MAHATKSVNNPYGRDQVPEWELWEEAMWARGKEMEHADAIAGWDRERVNAGARAAAIEEALTKLSPPKAGS